MVTVLPDARYAIEAFATDPTTSSVLVHAVFQGTHTGQGGPVPPTGQATSSDYVYVMRFDGPRIRHLIKIWNSGWALGELHWA